MWVGLLTDTINNKLEKSNLINEHALNCEPVPLTKLYGIIGGLDGLNGSPWDKKLSLITFDLH